MDKYSYCGYCGNKLTDKTSFLTCAKCNKNTFRSSNPAVGAYVIDSNKFLISKRAHPPAVGKYDVVGGFLDYGETPQKGLLREFKEETDLDIEIVDLLNIYIGDYHYQGDKLKVLVIIYIAKIVGGQIKPQDDVASLHWLPINKLPQMKELAFPVIKETLVDLQKWHQKNKK